MFNLSFKPAKNSIRTADLHSSWLVTDNDLNPSTFGADFNFHRFKVKSKISHETQNPESKKPDFIQYNEPTTKADMAILLVYFNPCKYKRIIQNALLVKQQMDCANMPYFIGEIKHDSDLSYLFQKSDNVFQYSSNSYLFYKENLISTIDNKISDNFTKICIMDFDVFFDNPDWYSIVSEKLNSVQVVQPFKYAHFLNIDFSIGQTKSNCVDNKTTEPIDYVAEHSGFVWAFDREWFKSYFFDDKFISGIGDTIFANNITKRSFNDVGSQFYYKYNSSDILFSDVVKYDSCELNVYHLNHGPLANRQYANIIVLINEIFVKNNIKTIDEIFLRREDNILEFHPRHLIVLNEFMLAYFKRRDDDFVHLLM